MRECAFCPNPAVSKGGEHIWSAWISRALPHKKYRLREFSENGAKHWIKKTLNTKAAVVCESCNNGWMSKLENDHAKPALESLILRDRLSSLTPERLKSIANFAFKTAVVANHMESDRQPFFDVNARRSFAKSLTIPRGVQIWLSAFKEEGHGLARAVYHASPKNAVRPFELYVLTFGAGFLLFQFVGARWLNAGISGCPFVKQGSFWNKFCIPFWPSDDNSVLWPPNKQFDLRLVRPFTLRWKDTSVPRDWASPC